MLVNGPASDQMWVYLALVGAQMSGNDEQVNLWTQMVRWVHNWDERGVKE